jgi:hypothetical protein
MGLAERNTGEHPLDLRYSHLRLHAAPHYAHQSIGGRKAVSGKAQKG